MFDVVCSIKNKALRRSEVGVTNLSATLSPLGTTRQKVKLMKISNHVVYPPSKPGNCKMWTFGAFLMLQRHTSGKKNPLVFHYIPIDSQV